MKKGLLLVLGILGAYQLGYSENVETKLKRLKMWKLSKIKFKLRLMFKLK